MQPPWSVTEPVQAYRTVRERTEQLAAPLGPEDQVVQSMPDASPTKWHRAHTTWFFEEFLLGAGVAGTDPSYRFLFNSYYEAVGPRQARADRGLLTRPTVAEVAAYRTCVDEAVTALLEGGPHPLLELGLHHEEQHQELLLMDVAHLFSVHPLRPAYAADGPHPTASTGSAGWIDADGGAVEVGHAGSGFAFDNEGPRHEVLLRPYRLADRPVTCGEWCEFVDDGGYVRPELWLSDGWGEVRTRGWEAPAYWRRLDGDWHVTTLGGERRVVGDEPVVHVSYYEADAFARWRGARLPTEFEWEAVAAARWDDPREQWHGSVWQWTASAYLPYPGFRPAAGAVGEYNGKFMVNQHVLRGGCCATPPGHSRPTYRNFFHPEARWAFSGLRLATDR